jgi:hypothetical protein
MTLYLTWPIVWSVFALVAGVSFGVWLLVFILLCLLCTRA